MPPKMVVVCSTRERADSGDDLFHSMVHIPVFASCAFSSSYAAWFAFRSAIVSFLVSSESVMFPDTMIFLPEWEIPSVKLEASGMFFPATSMVFDIGNIIAQ